MSSSIDQRSAKTNENTAEKTTQAKEVDYGYGSDIQQDSYSHGSMQPNADGYMGYYWSPYHNTPTSTMQGGWQGREGVYGGYPPVPNDYMYNQYDYSYWYQNVDPSVNSWNQQQQQQYYKGRDYPNGGSFYGGPQSSGNHGDDGYNNNNNVNGALQSAEQSFKNMSLSRLDEEEKDLPSQSMGFPSSKKSWANVVNSSKVLPHSKTIPRPPLNFSKGDSAWDKNKFPRQVPIGPYSAINSAAGGPYSAINSAAGGPYSAINSAAGGPYSAINSAAGGPMKYQPPAPTQFKGESSGDSTKVPPSAGGETFNGNMLDYNPKDFDLNPKGARFFVIKSFSEDDIHRSIKYSIWCSTEYGNKRLDAAFKERDSKGQVYLFFSVNGSGHFCGVALMTSSIDYNSVAEVWAQNKWKGQFSVRWVYVKDVPNSQLRHIKLENNENKPVTNSRDTQEIPCEKGKQVLRIIHQYRHTTSIFDDFLHYERQQEETQLQRK